MDKSATPNTITSKLQSAQFRQQVASFWSKDPPPVNKPANASTQPQMPSPFPPFLSTSLHGPKQEQSQNIQQPGVAKSDPAPGLNLLEGRMSKYLDLNADKKEALNESRSDVTQKKETIGSPTPEVHGGRGFMAKKSGKGGQSEIGIQKPAEKMAREGQVSSGTFNMMSSTTTEKYNYFSQKFKGPQVEQKTNEPDIPCLKKGSEDTAKPSGPSQKISNNGPNSDTSKLTSGPSIANPTAISSFKKSNDAANTPKFTTQNAPNPLMNLNVNTNQRTIFDRPATGNGRPQSQAQPNPLSSQQVTPRQYGPQNVVSTAGQTHNPMGSLGGSLPVMSGQQFQHKQQMLRVPGEQNQQILESFKRDFDLENLTVDRFIMKSHQVLKEIYCNLDFLSHQPQELLVQFQQHKSMKNCLQQLEHTYRCSPGDILQSIYAMESKQKEVDLQIQTLQQQLTQPLQQHPLATELNQMMEVEQALIDEEIQSTAADRNDLTAIYSHLASIEAEMDELNRHLDNYLRNISSANQ